MGKLRVLSAQEVCQILEQHGFIKVRQRDSHIIMQKQTDETTVTVVIANYAELRIALYSQLSASLDYHVLFLR